jgi:tRNA (guanine37-N1)-methyltransferase
MTSLKEALEAKLTKTQLEHLKRAYDVVGSIAILEIPKELLKKQKVIAEAVLGLHKNVKTVVKKAGIHSGKYRTQKMKILAGEKTKVTEYKENKVRLRLDVEKVYFSPRLSTERLRIANLVKKGESVLVMFSGCAPYPCVLAKNSEPKEIYGIEINPAGHKFAEENVRLNKISNVKLFKGDVRKVVPKLGKTFDRILMPLPKSAEDFLDVALSAANKGTIIHFYDFLHRDEFQKAVAKIEKACKKAKKKCKVLAITKCGQHAPRVFRICVDFLVR